MKWTDTRLKWVATNYENISTVHLAPDKVWHPDMMVYNSVQHFDYELTDLLVTSDGTVRECQKSQKGTKKGSYFKTGLEKNPPHFMD